MRTHPHRQGGTGGKVLVNPPKFKPFRDRAVRTILVACPTETCQAAPGQRCRTAEGKETNPHPGRRRLALRAEREAS